MILINLRVSITLIFVLLSSFYSYSQLTKAHNVTDEKGNRQGEWVIYYESDWEEVEDTSNVEFY